MASRVLRLGEESGYRRLVSEPQALVDAHAHLCDPVFDADREAVLERAREAGVGAVVAVGESIEDARRNLDLAAQFPDMAHSVLDGATESIELLERAEFGVTRSP